VRLWLGYGLAKAVRGLHELARAAKHPLRRGAGFVFLPAQENKNIKCNRMEMQGKKRVDE